MREAHTSESGQAGSWDSHQRKGCVMVQTAQPRSCLVIKAGAEKTEEGV